ncbi:MAG: hypothetical protein JKY65_18290 [Planctomycetes bacterium]|nr:hypothetical protein [Planctomycetota bacterium]
MREILRGFFVCDSRAEFISLFLWVGLVVCGLTIYSKVQGEPYGLGDTIVLAWAGGMLVSSAGLKWDFFGARWLGVACLLLSACSSWLFNLLRQEVSFGTLFGFVLLGWAIQLVRLDFEREDLELHVKAFGGVLAAFVTNGVVPPKELGDPCVEAALKYHLRRHTGDWAQCVEELCEKTRALEILLKDTLMPPSHEELHERAQRESSDEAPPSDAEGAGSEESSPL